VVERACIMARKGAKGPILREICPLKKMTPNYNAASGTIAGELLSYQILFIPENLNI
jgi:hypothetical protein